MEPRPWQRHYDYTIPTTIRYPRIPAHEILNIPVSAFPDKAATNFYGTELSFWELKQQAVRMANALVSLGITKGDFVGIHLPNCPQYLIAYYAVLMLGGIVVNLNPLYTAPELKAIAEDTGISTLFSLDLCLPNVRVMCKDLKIQNVIVTRATDYIDGFPTSTPEELELEKGWHHFSQVLEKTTSTKIPRVEVVPEDPALIQFTGGTTGIPKGAVLTHANIIAAIMQISVWGSSTTSYIPPERRTILSVIPYFHVYGNIVALGWAMINCATQFLVPRFEIDEFMGLLANFKEITFFPAVPTIITAIINHPKAEELELGKKIGLINSGAAPMPVELIGQCKDLGINYSEGWGMSETSSMGMANPVFGLKKEGSIGIPFPDTDVRLVDTENGVKDVPKGEPGELIIKSPLLLKEYLNRPQETADQLRDGWLYTGDIAIQDEDDYFFIVDRKKDMIIAGGFNIYPREIDEVLHEHPKVLEAVAVGIPDEYRGETVKAYIVPKKGANLTEKDIDDFCKERLAPYKRPKIIEFRKELPKSAIGKVLRKVLREEEESKKKKANSTKKAGKTTEKTTRKKKK